MVALAGKGLTPLTSFSDATSRCQRAWKESGKDPETGWVREERLLLPPGASQSNHLLLQVRYREAQRDRARRARATRTAAAAQGALSTLALASGPRCGWPWETRCPV